MPAKIQPIKMLAFRCTIAFAASTVAMSVVAAQSQQSPASQPAAVAAAAQESAAAQAQESSEPQALHLLVGRSLVITSPSRIKRISFADPDIA